MTKITTSRRNRLINTTPVVKDGITKMVRVALKKPIIATPRKVVELGEGNNKANYILSEGQRINIAKNKIRRARKDQRNTPYKTRKQIQ